MAHGLARFPAKRTCAGEHKPRFQAARLRYDNARSEAGVIRSSVS